MAAIVWLVFSTLVNASGFMYLIFLSVFWRGVVSDLFVIADQDRDLDHRIGVLIAHHLRSAQTVDAAPFHRLRKIELLLIGVGVLLELLAQFLDQLAGLVLRPVAGERGRHDQPGAARFGELTILFLGGGGFFLAALPQVAASAAATPRADNHQRMTANEMTRRRTCIRAAPLKHYLDRICSTTSAAVGAKCEGEMPEARTATARDKWGGNVAELPKSLPGRNRARCGVSAKLTSGLLAESSLKRLLRDGRPWPGR